MRADLRTIPGIPEHIGLAYDSWAPVGERGKVPDEKCADWLENLSNLQVSPDYGHALERWRRSFTREGNRMAEVEFASRLLVGHGNASATGVGLTVHHTWGVPVIPGSALKGLLSHYVEAVYGPDEPGRSPSGEGLQGDDLERVRYRGVIREGRRILHGPGEVHRALFGAPDADGDEQDRASGATVGAAAGGVVFHDALYMPRRLKKSNEYLLPFAADVLTVHQKRYYDDAGKSPSLSPSDYDDPNPVAFLTVRPRAHFLIALSGREDWTALAFHLLRQALTEWGIGGKTAAGYGRISASAESWQEQKLPAPPARGVLAEFLEWLAAPPPQADGSPLPQRQILKHIEDSWLQRLQALSARERAQAGDAIRRNIKDKNTKLVPLREDLIARLAVKS